MYLGLKISQFKWSASKCFIVLTLIIAESSPTSITGKTHFMTNDISIILLICVEQ